jgi:homoserine O-acetyltransferase
LRFAELGDMKLESGGVIRDCRIGYRTFGKLNAGKSNAILFPTWFSGTTEQLRAHIGPGRLVDSEKYYVVAVDALGNGVSSSPSNSKSQRGAVFPRFTIRDMVESQHRLLTEVLEIKSLHAVMGISMGGMQTFQWMVSHPDFTRLAVPIIGTPRQTSTDQLLWQAELKAIELGERCGAGSREAMEIVAAIHAFALYTPGWRARATSLQQFPQFFAEEAERLKKGMAPEDWASQLRAMLAHDVSKPLGGTLEAAARAVRARTLVVVASQDHMVNPEPALAFAKLVNAEVLTLTGDCGHMATTCEADKTIPAVARFLAQR